MKNGVNIFNDYDQIEENRILLYSIAGILELLNISLNMIISNDILNFQDFIILTWHQVESHGVKIIERLQ